MFRSEDSIVLSLRSDIVLDQPRVHVLRRDFVRDDPILARALTVFLVLCFHILITEFAWQVVLPRYTSDGYFLAHFNLSSLALATLVSAVPALVLPIRFVRSSDGVLWVLYFLIVIPTGVVPIMIVGVATSHLFGYQTLLVLSFSLVCLGTRRSKSASATLRPTSSSLRTWGSVALTMTILGVLSATFGIPTSFLDISNVYVARLEFRDVVSSQNVVFGYLIPWLQNSFAPILIAVGVVSRRVVVLGVGIIAEAWIYLTMGNRQALLGVGLIFVAIVVMRSKLRNLYAPLLVTLFIAAIAGNIAYDDHRDANYVTAIVAYRTFVLPGVIVSEYYQFFEGHPKIVGRDGVFSTISRSPYDKSAPFLIGTKYFQNEATSANVNIWADGFANFGLFGFVLVPALLLIVLRILDRVGSGSRAGPIAAGSMMLAATLANTGILTALLTGGLGVFLVGIYFNRNSFERRRGSGPAESNASRSV